MKLFRQIVGSGLVIWSLLWAFSHRGDAELFSIIIISLGLAIFPNENEDIKKCSCEISENIRDWCETMMNDDGSWKAFTDWESPSELHASIISYARGEHKNHEHQN